MRFPERTRIPSGSGDAGRGIGRELERASAWIAAIAACVVAALGLVGPRLGGPGPGITGPVGFASETVLALWVPAGALIAVVAGVALLRRHWWPAAALVVVALTALGPELSARVLAPGAPARADAPSLRIASVNLNGENAGDPLMEESLRRLDADVLVLPEFSPPWRELFERWFADDYPHRWLAAPPPDPDAFLEGLELAVWSRLPPDGEPEVRNLRGGAQIRVPLRWRGRAFALYGIHPKKPFPFTLYGSAWRDRSALLDWIRAERLPLVVAGDFNAPPHSAFLHQLRASGLTNASEAVCGYAPGTWPMDVPLPVSIAIDHVMHDDAFVAVGFGLGMATNSDHAPVHTELVWREE